MKDPQILALDLATRTGWVHSNGEGGIWDLKLGQDDSAGMQCIELEGRIRRVMNGPGIRLIVFEEANVGRGKRANFRSTKHQIKLQAVIERLAAKKKKLECVAINNKTIKAHALPMKGQKRDKEAMLKAAKKKWSDIEIIDHNHADALWLLDLAKLRYGVE